MSWFVFALTGLTIWSATAVADRFLLLRHVSSKRFYVALPALLQFPLLLLLLPVLPIPAASPAAIVSGVASGILGGIFLFFLFTAIGSEEVGRLFSLTNLDPILTLLFSWLFLHEVLTVHQFYAFGLFLLGGTIISFHFGGKKIVLSRALKPLLIGVLIDAAGTVLLRGSFVASNFYVGFFYSRFGFFLVGVVLMLLYWKKISTQWSALQPHIRTFVVGNQLLAFVGHFFFFFAISLTNAALVQSLYGVQALIVLVFAVIVSYWWPESIEESLHPRDLIQKVVGALVVVVATFFLYR